MSSFVFLVQSIVRPGSQDHVQFQCPGGGFAETVADINRLAGWLARGGAGQETIHWTSVVQGFPVGLLQAAAYLPTQSRPLWSLRAAICCAVLGTIMIEAAHNKS